MSHIERVVVLVDMDCFYCQVEEKLNPELEGKPIAVVQYNAWRGGGIIAVNYPARDKGVTRQMRGDDAKQKCPDIVLARVPQVRGKADLTKYREAGKKVAEVLQNFTNLLERASIDEAYLDITAEVEKKLEQGIDQITIDKLANTFVVGYNTNDFIQSLKVNSEFSESNIRLAVGGMITEVIRAEILKRTGYKCSAGVAHNKILAKLVCGLHKPNKQTIVPQNTVPELYKDLPIKKIKSLGGKFGNALAEELQITYMGELVNFTEKELCKKFDEKTSKWLYNIARGIDLESVTVRLVSKSIGCCKRFPGKTALITGEDVEHWISELASEISERLEKDMEENNRRARQMVVSFTQETNDKESSSCRTHPLQSYEQSKIARSAMDVIRRFCLRANGSYHITFLGLSVGNFQDLKNSVDISSLFKNMNNKESKTCFDEKSNSDSKSIENSMKIKSANSFFQSWLSSDQEPKCNANNYSNNEVSSSKQNKCDSGNVGTSNIEKLKNQTKNASNGKIKNSFFLNYFMNEGKNFLKMDDDIFKSKKNTDNTEEENLPLLDQSNKQVIFIDQHTSKIEKTTCPDCNKEIILSEYPAHLDYHFALNMVKDEAHLYSKAGYSVEEGNKKKTNRSRNNGDKKQPGPIQLLFQNNVDGRNSVMNAKCSKQVEKLEKIQTQAVSLQEEHSNKEPNILGVEPMEAVPGPDLTKNKDFDKELQNCLTPITQKDVSNEFTSVAMHLQNKMKYDDDTPTTSRVADEVEDLFQDNCSSDPSDMCNLSVYSADTEDLNEDTTNLIYFEDIFSDSDSSQPVFRNNEVTSVMPEENCAETNKINTFSESSSDQSHLNVIKKCFDKGDDLMLMEQLNPINENIKVRDENNEKLLIKGIEKEINTRSSGSPAGDKKDCPECKKTIPSAEFLSHLDYHFALKLVKDEAHLYKKTSIQEKSKSTNKNNKTTQSIKRKLSDSNKIVTFLQKETKEVLNETNSELCTECNKRIKLEETDGHADYHAAKKLHSELNVNKKIVETSVKVKDKKSKSVMNIRTISNFFKV